MSSFRRLLATSRTERKFGSDCSDFLSSLVIITWGATSLGGSRSGAPLLLLLSPVSGVVSSVVLMV